MEPEGIFLSAMSFLHVSLGAYFLKYFKCLTNWKPFHVIQISLICNLLRSSANFCKTTLSGGRTCDLLLRSPECYPLHHERELECWDLVRKARVPIPPRMNFPTLKKVVKICLRTCVVESRNRQAFHMCETSQV